VKSNPKKFWKYAQSKTKTKVSIPNLYTNERKDTTSSDEEKAEVLAAVEVDSDLPAVDSRTNHKLESIEITPDKVEKKLKDLKISKSPGPDNFHTRVLRELSSVLSAPLSIIYNTSITSGTLPEIWKCAIVTALFKKGDRKVAGNYRSISLTCIICKVLESIEGKHSQPHETE
jgi:hypothetical protein